MIVKSFVAVLVLWIEPGTKYEARISEPTMDACALTAHATRNLMLEWSAGYPDAWIDTSRADCAMISASGLWSDDVPPPAFAPEREIRE